MPHLRFLVFALVAAAAGASIGAQAPPTARSEMKDAGTDLARLIYPASLNSAIVGYTFAHVVEPGYRADPHLVSLEAAHPGIITAIIAAIRPEFERGRAEALPTLWAHAGALYARRLDLGELREAIAFHGGLVGRRLRDAEAQAIASAGEAVPDVAVRPDPPQVAVAKPAFDATPAGRKLIALRPEIEAIVDAWNKAPTPQANARIETALARVMTRLGVSVARARR